MATETQAPSLNIFSQVTIISILFYTLAWLLEVVVSLLLLEMLDFSVWFLFRDGEDKNVLKTKAFKSLSLL